MNIADIRQLKPSDQDATPKYLQIARKMTGLIESKVWPQDFGIPSERQLMEMLDVSRVTARRALQVVTEKGLLVRKPGSGTYVAPHLDQPLSRLSSFSEELNLRGMASSSVWLLRDRAVASAQEVRALGLLMNTYVCRFKRIRSADQMPMAIEYCRLPSELVDDPMKVDQSLYAYLDARATPVTRALQTISAVNANEEQARLLKINRGDAVLYVTRLGYGKNGKPMEFTESYCRPDVYDFVAELHRSANVAPDKATLKALAKLPSKPAKGS
jgi:GntR family transcriptional regulator